MGGGMTQDTRHDVPGKPAACSNGLLSINYRLAHCFGLLGFPGTCTHIHILSKTDPVPLTKA